ncbi:MAG: 2Fe-2S iron-sulfur cluster-binding protein [Vicinamibacterales bacterium]
MADFLTTPAASSLLAFFTTIHLGLAALLNHRRESGVAGILLVLVSLAFAAAPWLLPSIGGLAAGVAVHAAWFTACGRMAAPRASAVAVQAVRQQVRAPRASASTKTFTSVPVLAVVNETPEVSTFRLGRPAGFAFVPGQFVTVRLAVDGREMTRCYSISSAPESTAYLEISVRRQGVFSGALHASVRAGHTLSIMGPLGSFVYPAGDDPLVLIAGGVGITPLISMLRHVLATAPGRRVTLFYSARNDAEFAFRDELAALARRHDQFTLVLASSATREPGVYQGRVGRDLVAGAAPHVAASVVCMCGPGAMVESLREALEEMGVPRARIRYELFEAAVAASVGGAAASRSDAVSGSAHTMTCLVSGKTLPIAGGQTLLEAAEQGDVDLPSLCRAGICGTCRVQVTEGDVRCASASLAADERADGFVLACVSTADSDCRVNL